MKIKEIIFRIIFSIIDFILIVLILHYNYENSINLIMFTVIAIEFYVYYLCFVKVRNKRYSDIEKLYSDKKNRYKGLYIFFSELHNELDVEDKFLIRTIKVNNAIDKISIPLIGSMLTLFTLLFDNFEKILISFITVVRDLLNYRFIEINFTEIGNGVRVFCLFAFFYLLISFINMVHSVAIKTYVNHVIEDVERDRCTYNSHGISNNEIMINSLESE